MTIDILHSRILDFKNLEYNWNTYDAEKISLVSIVKALDILIFLDSNRNLLKKYIVNVFPMTDGGIQFDFDDIYELEINPLGILNLIKFNYKCDIVEQKIINIKELENI